jgi:hypothetical protein
VKKIVAIFFILVFLFNLAGYQAWYYFAEREADIQIIVDLDNESYNDEDLITIKVPLSLPYQTDCREFERVDGELNLDGKI